MILGPVRYARKVLELHCSSFFLRLIYKAFINGRYFVGRPKLIICHPKLIICRPKFIIIVQN
jgi:hypothetical protein